MAIIVSKKAQFRCLYLVLGLLLLDCKKIDPKEAQELQQLEIDVNACFQTDSLKALALCRGMSKKYSASAYAKAETQLGYAQIYDQWDCDSLAGFYANQALTIAEHEGYHLQQAKAYLIKARLAKNFDSTLAYLLKFDKIQQDYPFDNPHLQYRFFIEYGYYHYQFKDYIKATNNFKIAWQIAHQNKMYKEESQCLNAQGMVLADQEKYTQALQKTEEAIKLCNQYAPSESGDMYFQKGVLLSDLHRYDEAEKAILIAHQKFEQHPHPHDSGNIAVVLGDIYLANKQYTRAKNSYERFLKEAKHASTKLWAYNKLTKFYEKTSNFQQTIIHQNLFLALKDSVYSAEKASLLMSMELDFELKQKEQRVEHKEFNYRMSLLFAVLLIATVVWVSWLYQRVQASKILLAQTLYDKQQMEVALKNRELATNTLSLSQYVDVLRKLKQEINKLSIEDTPAVKTILKLIDKNLHEQNEWERFKIHFEAVSPAFFEYLKKKNPKLSELDLKHCAYLKMKMTPKQVAELLGVSPKSVTLSRVRIKKKLELEKTQSLADYLEAITL